ncbi:MAG: hypothetical protein JST80_07670 [Bdellovibrionales bacterium]|nr:hypothetical protein [Bdellovibrionales bacterium]
MNGNFLKPALRTSFSVLWVGSCLVGSFALGSRIHNPLKMTTLDFSSVNWAPSKDSLQLATLDDADLEQNILQVAVDFQPFELSTYPAPKSKKLAKKSYKNYVNPWTRLSRAVNELKLASLGELQNRAHVDQDRLFDDYSSAIVELRKDFVFAMVPQLKSDQYGVMVAQSSADQIKIEAPATKTEITAPKAPVVHVIPAHKTKKVAKTSKVEVLHTKKLATHSMSIQEMEMESNKLDNEIKIALDNSITAQGGAARIPQEEHVKPQPIARKSSHVPEYKAYVNPNVNEAAQKKVLTEALLNAQLSVMQGKVVSAGTKQTNPSQQLATTAPNAESPNVDKINSSKDDDEINPDLYQVDASTQDVVNTPSNASNCEELKKTRFINSTGTQVCPMNQTWISKDWTGKGWVKADMDGALPVLSYYPAPNTGTTLAIETNSLALLGLTSGSRVMKGMGVVIGNVPEGYKIEFAGRSEEPEYFDVQGKKYFALINAEPGAGVVQLISPHDQEAATVFAPVLEDTITSLDLTAPKLMSFTVKVVKNEGRDPDVAGLTLGVSTFGKIQAITQTNGRAVIRNIPLIPNYPVYLDVSSKVGNDQGYAYRYLLKNRNRAGDYVVHQVNEKTLFHWIKQVKQGLSDQSAMIVGFYNRKKLDGFKEHYFVKANPQTAKFGLEPFNYTVLWDNNISDTEPLEGDLPRFMAVQVPEGLTQVNLTRENGPVVHSELIPVSPRVIHVISE